MSRLHKGIPAGTFLGEVLAGWNLYKLSESKFKLCVSEPVASGKANYTFGMTSGKIDSHLGLDGSKLRTERADLAEAAEKFILERVAAPEAKNDQADPFGDHAISRKHKLRPEQQWKRELLAYRRKELEWAAIGALVPGTIVPNWTPGVRMLFTGCFKEKITADQLVKALAYITGRDGAINLEALLKVEQDYYEGKYAPDPCSQLELQLDIIAGVGFGAEAANANPFA